MKSISLGGKPGELGTQLAEQIRHSALGFAREILSDPARAGRTNGKAARDLRAYLQSAAPFLVEEIDAFGQALGLSAEEAFFLTHLEDIPGPDLRWPGDEHNCTIVIVRNQAEGAIFANTMDISARFRQFFHMRDYRPADGRRFACTARAGLIGCSRGTNDAGLAMGGTSAPYSGSAGPGLGLYVAIRLALQTCATTRDVIDLFSRHTPPSKGMCYGVADAGGEAAIIEATHGEMAVRPIEGQYIYATNRFETPALTRLNAGRGKPNALRCEIREELLDDFLGSPQRTFGISDAQAALRLKADDKLGVSNERTQFGVVAVTKQRRFFIADGPPADADFVQHWHCEE